ncbi:MAG: hypothetical protein WDN49_15525 [Acetobacteraceae bacterium]
MLKEHRAGACAAERCWKHGIKWNNLVIGPAFFTRLVYEGI